MAFLAQGHPDVIILAPPHRGRISFRGAMLAADVTADALMGPTMAQCVPDFAGPG